MKYIVGRKKKKKGFTLMELLVSLGIIAALSMMVAPMIMGKVDEAKVKADISNANAIAVAVKSEMISGSAFTGTLTDTQKLSIANEYFDGKLPKPQSVEATGFVIALSGTNNKIVTISAGGEQFYPREGENIVVNP